MALTDQVSRFWEGATNRFDVSVRQELDGEDRTVWAALLAEHSPPGRLDVLDLGTGPGFLAILLAEAGNQVTALDAVPSMLERARENATAAGVTIELLGGDAGDPSLVPGSFDLIVSRNLTWLLLEPERAYRRWHDLLRPGGRLLIFDGNWYGWLDDPVRTERFQRQQELAIAEGMVPFDPEVIESGNAIARALPLTGVLRPHWDLPVLLDAGFAKVYAERDASDQLLHGPSRTRYVGYPAFIVRADRG